MPAGGPNHPSWLALVYADNCDSVKLRRGGGGGGASRQTAALRSLLPKEAVAYLNRMGKRTALSLSDGCFRTLLPVPAPPAILWNPIDADFIKRADNAG